MNAFLFVMAVALPAPSAFACPGASPSGDQAQTCEHHGKMSCQHEKKREAKAGAPDRRDGAGEKKTASTVEGEKTIN